MDWREFEAAAPDLAQLGRERFERRHLALIGTLRQDGSPRISPVEPLIAYGQLFLGMLWRSTKALDLLRDPRCIVHSVVADREATEGEFKLRGRALEVEDPDLRGRFRQAFHDRWGVRLPEAFHIFWVDIEAAAFIGWEDGGQQQVVRRWDAEHGLREVRRRVL